VIELRDVAAESRARRTAETVDRVARRRAVSRWLELDAAREQVERVVAESDAESAFLDVVDTGVGEERVVGSVWLGRDGDEVIVRDLVLEPASLAADLLPVLVERARTQGATMIGIGVQPGDTAHAALAALPGFRVRATNMALTLSDEVADPSPLVLHPMTQEEFEVFLAGGVEEFAEELAASGMDRERALERSREQMAELLPSGLDSPGMEFHVARVGHQVVGDLWLATGAGPAFVYNIEVRPDQRRRGYGAAIMNAAALHCRDLGHPVLGLNVFAHNPGARALYDRLGYRVTLEYSALDVPDGA
jgi:ribosomal protein S18 acetylase RimI-like enzyme